MLRSRTRLMAVLAVLALVLAACGGTDSADTTAAPDTGGGDTGTTAGGDSGGSMDVPSSPENGVTDDTIKVGWMGDITGPTAATQDFVNAGVRAYMDKVNEEGGVAGRQIEVITKDDQYAPEAGVTNFQALWNDDNVLTIVGQGGSGIIAALLPDIQAAGIPFVDPQQTTDDQLGEPLFYNVIAHYGDQADIVVAKAAEDVGGAENLVMASVGLEVASGEEWALYVEDTVNKAGGTYLEHLRLPLQAEDANAQAIRLKELIDSDGLNYIALHGSPGAAIRLLNSMEAQGVDLPIGGIFAVIAENVYQEGPADLVDTFFGVHTYTPSNISTPGNDEMNAWVEASGNSEYQEKVTNTNFVVGWVAAKLAVEGMRRAAETGELTRASLAAALDGISDFDTGGQTPVLDCTREGHACGAAARPYVWNGTELEPEGDYADWAQYLDYEYGLAAAG